MTLQDFATLREFVIEAIKSSGHQTGYISFVGGELSTDYVLAIGKKKLPLCSYYETFEGSYYGPSERFLEVMFYRGVGASSLSEIRIVDSADEMKQLKKLKIKKP